MIKSNITNNECEHGNIRNREKNLFQSKETDKAQGAYATAIVKRVSQVRINCPRTEPGIHR